MNLKNKYIITFEKVDQTIKNLNYKWWDKDLFKKLKRKWNRNLSTSFGDNWKNAKIFNIDWKDHFQLTRVLKEKGVRKFFFIGKYNFYIYEYNFDIYDYDFIIYNYEVKEISKDVLHNFKNKFIIIEEKKDTFLIIILYE